MEKVCPSARRLKPVRLSLAADLNSLGAANKLQNGARRLLGPVFPVFLSFFIVIYLPIRMNLREPG